MVHALVCASVFLHARFKKVAPAFSKFIAYPTLTFLELGVVAIVVFLDDLEGPSSLKDVSTDQRRLQVMSYIPMTGIVEEVDRFTQSQVGLAGEPVEAVQAAAGVLDDFQCLGKFSQCGNSLLREAVGNPVLGCRLLAILSQLFSFSHFGMWRIQ